MSEHGKTCLACGEWIPRGGGYARCDNCQPEFELNQKLTTAETAATEYAQQAAELQEEVERLRSLWIEYRNATDAGSNYFVLAELFKRFDGAIRGTE